MPNTAKQTAIRKAYGEYWEQVKDSIDDEGYILGNAKSLPKIEFDGDGFGYIRPKSLQGIESNNGWTIANVSDLPTEGIFNVGKFLNDGSFHQGNDDVEWYDLREYIVDFGFTHYQPIVKPEKPIY